MHVISIKGLNNFFWILILLSNHIIYIKFYNYPVGLYFSIVAAIGLILLNCRHLLIKKNRVNEFTIFAFFLVTTLLSIYHWSNLYYFNFIELFKAGFQYFLYIGLILILNNNKADFSSFQDIYLMFVKINAAAVIVQFALYVFLDIKSLFFWQAGQLTYFRPCGLLGEPSYVGQLMFSLMLFPKEKVSRYLIATVIVSLFITSSSISFLIAIILYLKFFGISQRTVKYSVLVTAIIAILLINQSDNIHTLARFQNAVALKDLSSVIRIVKGFNIYSKLGLTSQLIGIAPGNLQAVADLYTGTGSQYISNYETVFYSGLSYELISFGLVGTLILNVLIFLFFKNNYSLIPFVIFEVYKLGESLTFNNFSILVIFINLVIVGKYKSKEYLNGEVL